MSDKPMAPPKILVVDDRVANRVAIEAILEGMEVEVFSAASGEEALGLVLEHSFAVVLMDVQMPGMDGFETVGIMRQHPRTRSLPVVFITAISTERRFVSKGYEVGAVDYLFKPVDAEILRGKVRVFVELDTKTRLLEQRNAKLERLSAKLRDISITDPLTGLHNRRFFTEIVESEVSLTRRQQLDSGSGSAQAPTNSELAFLMVDIDHFKRVNDQRGHDVGDQVLVEVAARIRDSLRASDTIVRWGGEEFLALLRRTEADGLERVAERIRSAVADAAVEIEGAPDLRVTCSTGFCRYPLDHSDKLSWSDVVTMADKALYLAKNEGRNTWVGVEYGVDVDVLSVHKSDLADLDDAARRGLIRLQRPAASR